MTLVFDRPALLWLAPLALLPFASIGQKASAYPWLAIAPRDALSSTVDALLRLLAAVAIAALALGLAGPYRKRVEIERVGEGAHIVLLLDRSVSMDQTFANRLPTEHEESKTAASVRLVKALFVVRPHDQFAVVAFSTSPILAMPMTAKREPIMAALDAMNRPALAHTDIGRGLGLALASFKTDFDLATKVILFVSDGAGVIDRLEQETIRSDALKLSVHLYYLYLRTEGDQGLFEVNALPDKDAPAALDRFFQSLGVSYRAFEADNPEAIKTAVETIDRLEANPVRYSELTPRRDYGAYAYAAACAALLILLAARLAERRLGDAQARKSFVKGAAPPP